MPTAKLALSILTETLGICRLEAKSKVPDWALQEMGFRSVTRTADELSLVLPQDKIPGGILAEKGWRAFKVEGPTNLFSVGVIAALAEPLAKAGISIFNISTYETDYLMVEEKNLEKAVKILGKFCDIKQ